MKKEEYNRTELEIIDFRTEDVLLLSEPEEDEVTGFDP